jgi:hypothetical protein
MKPVAAAAPQPPAERLAPVLVSIVNAPTGAQHMTLRLQPEALGQLQIQIDHVPDAPIQIRIEAERPQTLALLQRDTPQLQRALDQAGIQRDTMTLSFHAAPAVAAVPLAQDAGQTSQQFMGTGQPYQGFGEGRPHHAPFAWVEANDGPTSPADSVAQPHALRTGPTGSGIDITA